MSKTYPADTARNWIGSALDYVTDEDDEVIVERNGEPRVAIVPIAAFEELRALREQKRRDEAIERLIAIREERKRNGTFSTPSTATAEERAEAWARLEALREEVSARNADLTEEQIEEISVRFSREMIDDMVAEGKISFERDLPKQR